MLNQMLVTFAILCVFKLCTALPVTRSPPHSAVVVRYKTSVIVSARTCNATDSLQFTTSVGLDEDNPRDLRFSPNRPLSYYRAQATGYVITDWTFNSTDNMLCKEVAARVFNFPGINHTSISIVFSLLNVTDTSSRSMPLNITRFDIALQPQSTESTASIPTTATASSPSSFTILTEVTTSSPGSFNLGAVSVPAAAVPAIVGVSLAVAAGALLCVGGVGLLVAVTRRNRRHTKPSCSEETALSEVSHSTSPSATPSPEGLER